MSASSASSATAYKPVVIANGWSPSDVGTAAPLAASLGGSVLYANTASLGDPTVDALKQLKPSEIILVGGTAALTADIVTELGEVVPDVPVTRLAGDDRIHTAALAALHTLGSAVPVVTDTGAQSEASTGPGNAQDYQNGYSEARFRVGTDLLPGVWQFTSRSGGIFTYGSYCRHSYAEAGSNAAQHYVTVNDQPTRGDEERLSSVSRTFRFGLVEGDVVTLQAAAGDICQIERVSD
ncbi:hypothetical protein [Candidatus Poriferisodalis sp.]|uniref:hypothetical protein n=1 Tax=Candidatus Poriferisodalis sp. TaxID=3101277 RepID=UPI003C6F8686